MFAIAFDLRVRKVQEHHGDVAKAYKEIGHVLQNHGFTWAQGSLYVSNDEDMARLFRALLDLKALSWFPDSVRDIRAFRVEQWSDFTSLVKS